MREATRGSSGVPSSSQSSCGARLVGRFLDFLPGATAGSSLFELRGIVSWYHITTTAANIIFAQQQAIRLPPPLRARAHQNDAFSGNFTCCRFFTTASAVQQISSSPGRQHYAAARHDVNFALYLLLCMLHVACFCFQHMQHCVVAARVTDRTVNALSHRQARQRLDVARVYARAHHHGAQ